MRVTTILTLIAGGVLGCQSRAFDQFRFDAGMPVVPPKSEEPRQVHFSFSGPDAVTFRWRGTGTTLRYWARDVPPRIVEAHAPRPLPSASTGPWQEAVADRLVPGKEYSYEVGHPMRPLPLSFRAPLARGAAAPGFTVVAIGDFGAAADRRISRVVHRLIRIVDPAFVIGLGDQAGVDRHSDDAMAWSVRSAYMPLSDGQDRPWFDHGAVRFITYPEPESPQTWTDWAEKAEPLFAAAEADPALRFIVTAGHQAAYSSGRDGGAPELRAILDRFGKRFKKYVLNLSAPIQAYERSKPQGRVVHITSGGGGTEPERAATDCFWKECKVPAFIAFRAIHHNVVKLSFRPAVIAVEAICGPGSPGSNDLHCAEGEIMDQTLIPAGM